MQILKALHRVARGWLRTLDSAMQRLGRLIDAGTP